MKNGKAHYEKIKSKNNEQNKNSTDNIFDDQQEGRKDLLEGADPLGELKHTVKGRRPAGRSMAFVQFGKENDAQPGARSDLSAIAKKNDVQPDTLCSFSTAPVLNHCSIAPQIHRLRE